MSIRLRLEFSPGLVTETMIHDGLHKCWYEPLETTKTIGDLANEIFTRFRLDIDSSCSLQLSSGGFTLPRNGRLTLLRDGDLVAISALLEASRNSGMQHTVGHCLQSHRSAEVSQGAEYSGVMSSLGRAHDVHGQMPRASEGMESPIGEVTASAAQGIIKKHSSTSCGDDIPIHLAASRHKSMQQNMMCEHPNFGDKTCTSRDVSGAMSCRISIRNEEGHSGHGDMQQVTGGSRPAIEETGVIGLPRVHASELQGSDVSTRGGPRGPVMLHMTSPQCEPQRLGKKRKLSGDTTVLPAPLDSGRQATVRCDVTVRNGHRHDLTRSSSVSPTALKEQRRQFLLESEEGSNLRHCLVCNEVLGIQHRVLIEDMRLHVAAHQLKGHVTTDACGFCGQVGRCTSYLDQQVSHDTGRSILVPASNCPLFSPFSVKDLQSGEAAKRGQDCSNVPILCCACDNPTFVWKYDMDAHWREHHPEELEDGGLPQEYTVTSEERRFVLSSYPHVEQQAGRSCGAGNSSQVGGAQQPKSEQPVVAGDSCGSAGVVQHVSSQASMHATDFSQKKGHVRCETSEGSACASEVPTYEERGSTQKQLQRPFASGPSVQVSGQGGQGGQGGRPTGQDSISLRPQPSYDIDIDNFLNMCPSLALSREAPQAACRAAPSTEAQTSNNMAPVNHQMHLPTGCSEFMADLLSGEDHTRCHPGAKSVAGGAPLHPSFNPNQKLRVPSDHSGSTPCIGPLSAQSHTSRCEYGLHMDNQGQYTAHLDHPSSLQVPDSGLEPAPAPDWLVAVQSAREAAAAAVSGAMSLGPGDVHRPQSVAGSSAPVNPGSMEDGGGMRNLEAQQPFLTEECSNLSQFLEDALQLTSQEQEHMLRLHEEMKSSAVSTPGLQIAPNSTFYQAASGQPWTDQPCMTNLGGASGSPIWMVPGSCGPSPTKVIQGSCQASTPLMSDLHSPSPSRTCQGAADGHIRHQQNGTSFKPSPPQLQAISACARAFLSTLFKQQITASSSPALARLATASQHPPALSESVSLPPTSNLAPTIPCTSKPQGVIVHEPAYREASIMTQQPITASLVSGQQGVGMQPHTSWQSQHSPQPDGHDQGHDSSSLAMQSLVETPHGLQDSGNEGMEDFGAGDWQSLLCSPPTVANASNPSPFANQLESPCARQPESSSFTTHRRGLGLSTGVASRISGGIRGLVGGHSHMNTPGLNMWSPEGNILDLHGASSPCPRFLGSSSLEHTAGNGLSSTSLPRRLLRAPSTSRGLSQQSFSEVLEVRGGDSVESCSVTRGPTTGLPRTTPGVNVLYLGGGSAPMPASTPLAEMARNRAVAKKAILDAETLKAAFGMMPHMGR
ncbi:hypothetical protein CEUSTIGMA_g3071.t1 [Chlamydomonas eustigma]|uniref:Uncharacterized protein n=1 Tax=Chlamydomonas eustigma TaxID=1157962 RepID=A0A250WXR8_9CHLO|nr:hypothetical protein CEUSTIGMA_g3071.t1 [Chlamydomonas eustigma]|eukprot:GAX75627.1 hypothetical protein CEUSTIGMA_g3071.t1 [Chlamydomonas eustigma]